MVDPDGVDLALRHRERVKELAALHATARLLRNTSLSIDALLSQICALLPPAMQFPDDTSARIRFGAFEHTTAGFGDVQARLVRELETTDGGRGLLEVGYRSPHPDAQEGPFFAEERALVDSIAEILGAELERRVTEQAALDRQAKLALAVSAAKLGLWEWDIAKNHVVWSPESAAMVQRTAVEGRFAEHSFLVHEEDRDRVMATLQAALENPHGTFDQEFRFPRADGGAVWVGARAAHVAATSERGARVIAILTDITRRKLLEDRIAQLQKLEAMGRVAAGVAHDFNNLLFVLQVSASELLELIPADDERHTIVSEMAEVVGRGEALTKQLLAFSRKSEVLPILLEPDAVIRRAEPMLKRLIGAEMELVTDLDCATHIFADPTQLGQAIMNLVVNARDAMTEPGTITIRTRISQIDDVQARGYINVTAGRHATITVADTGHGIPPELKARLFEPFFTTKPAGKGTGLGLAVVFGVVQQCNGFVSVDSEPGAGAQFHIHIPAHYS
jgi:PAS domain S-box-containing protein